MKILYFHQHFSTPKGATGVRSYAMAKQMVDEGHEVIMVCGSYGSGKTGLTKPFQNGKREGEVDGINIIEFDISYTNSDGFLKRTGLFLLFAFRSIFVAMTEKYDVLFATTTPLTAGIPGIFARWLRRKTFVFEVRDLWPELPKEMGVIKNPIVLGAMSFLEWATYHSAHRIVGLSPGIVKGIVNRGVATNRVTMIPNGCDIDFFSKYPSRWRPEQVSETDFLAIFSGTHGIANGLDIVIDTAKELQSRNRSDIKIILIGSGKLKQSLIDSAKAANLNNIIFHDAVDRVKLIELLRGVDIGMQLLANVPAFYYGTSPNKFFDYIAAGLPVLNNYPGWLADMIEQNDCGYCVEPENPVAFADALEEAARNKNELRLKARNALTLAKTEFDRIDLAKRFSQFVRIGTVSNTG